MTESESADLAELALEIAREAGAFLLAGSDRVEAVGSKSSVHDLVTQMDRESESLIRARIAAVRPDDQVVGEEEGAVGAPARVRWIVDPLDGTVNYFYGQRSWAVSIGIEIDGTPSAGVVVAPGLGEEYLGVAGAGSWAVHRDGRTRLHVSEVTELFDAVVSTGFGYVQERRAHQAVVVAELLPQVRDIRRVGAAAIDLCWVARGALDAHYERGLQDWDRSAGAVIAQEAGARVTGPGGGPHSPELTVAANPVLHDRLAAVLHQLGADGGP